METEQALIRSYRKATWLYRIFWGLSQSAGMHYGLWDAATTTPAQASLRLLERMAHALSAQKGQRMLDAGCGYGGTALYLAQHFGVHVQGINLNPVQVQKARQLAKARNLEQQTSFLVGDFHHLPYPGHFFDSIISIEAIFHSPNKEQFFKEAARVLRPGGRLAFTDYIFEKGAPQAPHWEKYFMVGEKLSLSAMEQCLGRAGLRLSQQDNLSQEVLKGSKRLASLGKLAFPFTWPLQWLPNKLQQQLPCQHGHALGLLQQWDALQKGHWQYFLLVATKN